MPGHEAISFGNSLALAAILGGASLIVSGGGGAAPAQAGPFVIADQAFPEASDADVKYRIIVRFANDPALDRCFKSFRSDPVISRTCFDTWRADKPDITGFTLEHVSYSGEAILSVSAGGSVAGAQAVRDIAGRISKLAYVKYADPDLTAQPGCE